MLYVRIGKKSQVLYHSKRLTSSPKPISQRLNRHRLLLLCICFTLYVTQAHLSSECSYKYVRICVFLNSSISAPTHLCSCRNWFYVSAFHHKLRVSDLEKGALEEEGRAPAQRKWILRDRLLSNYSSDGLLQTLWHQLG